MNFAVADILRVQDGKIAEYWVSSDISSRIFHGHAGSCSNIRT